VDKSHTLRDLLSGKGTLVLQGIRGPLSIVAGLGSNLQVFSVNHLKEAGVVRVSLPSIAICATIQALLQTMDALKSGAFTNLIQKGRLCSGQDIGRSVGA
jgi:2-methylisocitrate lyase-like PEP mutase family enzyme